MNQDNNQLNQNNINIQGNNDLLNNQSNNNVNNTLNSQSFGQVQPQNDINMYQQSVQGNINNIPIQNNTISNNNYNQSIQGTNINEQAPNINTQGISNIIQANANLGFKNSNKTIKVLAIIGGIIVGLVILAIVIFSVISASSDKLVCESDMGNITIMYKKNKIVGYKANGMTYNLDEQQKYAKEIGIDEYIKEFNNWFVTNTSGICTIKGIKVEVDSASDSNNETKEDLKTVGDDIYGYISVPKIWVKFYDVDGNDSLQYSYANVYIISLNKLDKQGYTAKDFANNYMYEKQNDTSVTDVTGATVTIGKNKQYTAYQIYMYYPADSTYLITYWFEAEDDKIHYIALEGPGELDGTKISDYLYIPESFSLTK